MELSYTLSQIDTAAQKLWEQFNGKKVWAFYAEMGAGKTTLIHKLCELLQVKDAVSSPTFSIINEYKSPVAGTIYHMDWYRIKDEEEAEKAGVEDCINSNELCFIEWPEKAEGLMPLNMVNIHISFIDKQTRKITATAQ